MMSSSICNIIYLSHLILYSGSGTHTNYRKHMEEDASYPPLQPDNSIPDSVAFGRDN